MAAWEAGLRELATLANVYCKLSALPQAYAAPGWTSADFSPAVAVALDAFGAERVNYAGNWFVLEEQQWALPSGTYDAMLSAVEGALPAGADLDRVFSGTAAELYGVS